MSAMKYQILALIFLLFQPLIAGGKDRTDTFRVSLIQLDSAKVGNYSQMLEAALTAKSEGAELVVFPESSAFGWLNPKVFTNAKPIPGATSGKFSSIAKKAGYGLQLALLKKAQVLKINIVPLMMRVF